MLWQPKNDHLLFAHFGISVRIRRQAATSQIRRVVSLKRKLRRLLEKKDYPGTNLILRDVADQRYPYVDEKEWTAGNFGWRVVSAMALSYDGLMILERHHLAYYDHSQDQWDFASAVNWPHQQELNADPWRPQETPEAKQLREEAWDFWFTLPDSAMHHLYFARNVPFDSILEIDDVGDDTMTMPTIFVEFRQGKPVLGSNSMITANPVASYLPKVRLSTVGHVRIFPDKFRDLAWERAWFTRNNAPYSETFITLPPKPSRSGQ